MSEYADQEDRYQKKMVSLMEKYNRLAKKYKKYEQATSEEVKADLLDDIANLEFVIAFLEDDREDQREMMSLDNFDDEDEEE